MKTRSGWLTFLTIAMILILTSACASSDDSNNDSPAAAAEQPASVVDSSEIAAVEVEEKTQLHEGPNAALAAPDEAGADELAIISNFDRIVGAMNIEDWGATVEKCDPDWKPMTADDAKLLNKFVYGDRVEISGLNYRNVTIKTYKDGTAYSKADEYEFDQLLSEGIQHSWHVADDGTWYSTSFCNVPQG